MRGARLLCVTLYTGELRQNLPQVIALDSNIFSFLGTVWWLRPKFSRARLSSPWWTFTQKGKSLFCTKPDLWIYSLQHRYCCGINRRIRNYLRLPWTWQNDRAVNCIAAFTLLGRGSTCICVFKGNQTPPFVCRSSGSISWQQRCGKKRLLLGMLSTGVSPGMEIISFFGNPVHLSNWLFAVFSEIWLL